MSISTITPQVESQLWRLDAVHKIVGGVGAIALVAAVILGPFGQSLAGFFAMMGVSAGSCVVSWAGGKKRESLIDKYQIEEETDKMKFSFMKEWARHTAALHENFTTFYSGEKK